MSADAGVGGDSAPGGVGVATRRVGRAGQTMTTKD